MKSISYYIYAFCLLMASFAGCAHNPLSVHSEIDKEIIELAGKWKISDADNIQASRSEFNDSLWGQVEIPGRWDFVLEKNSDMLAVVWLRKKVVVSEDFRNKMMVLSLGSVSISDETYFNGVQIGSTGFVPAAEKALDYDFTWHYDRNYVVNSSLIRYGEENVIAMRVFSHYINGIKGNPKLYSITAWSEANRFKRYIPPVNNLSPLIISLLITSMLIIAAKGKLGVDVFVYSSLFVFGVVLVSLLLLGLPSMSNGFHRLKLFFGLYSLIDLFLLMSVRSFYRVKTKLPIIIVLICWFLLNLLIIFCPDTRSFSRYCTVATLVFLVISVSYAFSLLTIELYRDPMRYWFVYPLAVVVLISAINTYYLLASGQMYRMSFAFIFRLAIIGIMVLLYFLIDFKQIEKERNSLSVALLKKTRELQKISKQIPSIRKKEDSRDNIQRLIEYIDANFTETYDRIKLAEKFGLNEDYMGQLFKKVTNTNIANYINLKRIEAAQQLLEETDSKVIDIAFHVGFDNLTYFYRHFKNKTGYNPTDYRKIKREKYLDLNFEGDKDYF